MAVQSFAFTFAWPYRLVAFPFGVWPGNCHVTVTGELLRVNFGPWHLETPLGNIVGTERTGPFAFSKTAGPAHLSFTDRGVTFATNGDCGLCVRFRVPVRGIDPTGRIKHPAMTVTVTDIDRLERALTS